MAAICTSFTLKYNEALKEYDAEGTKHTFPPAAHIRYKHNGAGFWNFLTVVAAPTANCQVYTISPFCTFIQPYITKEEVLQLIKACKDSLNLTKQLIIFDVHDNELEKVKALGFEVITSTLYISTNDSRMILGMIKI